MANEPLTPKLAHKSQNVTVGKPIVPANQSSTRDIKPISPFNVRRTNAKPISPPNQYISFSQGGDSDKPAPPPNTESTKGGGK